MQPGGGARQQLLSINCIDCKNKNAQEMKQVNKMCTMRPEVVSYPGHIGGTQHGLGMRLRPIIFSHKCHHAAPA